MKIQRPNAAPPVQGNRETRRAMKKMQKGPKRAGAIPESGEIQKPSFFSARKMFSLLGIFVLLVLVGSCMMFAQG